MIADDDLSCEKKKKGGDQARKLKKRIERRGMIVGRGCFNEVIKDGGNKKKICTRNSMCCKNKTLDEGKKIEMVWAVTLERKL